ncbi:50S ribosomal protein L25/general stress protein Ctc [Candidatus Sneabacter namystus]|uniref:Large ribosomal subunit protein bL25 n=1 Tax=Candidatus Sneabacter namystus TaxID=2601646 RepID=A0A5C0UIT2_9RICK|nr:50S ribosomal protein L25/general stress protein Ctc [Candidatus Sneabacter namystus]QEK39660.1 50S ribosomal protein L25/general stress protein Ctc [Candidatus Sneabacter namystus]
MTEILASTRNVLGTGSSRASRKAGFIPAVGYGGKRVETFHVEVDRKSIEALYAKGALFNTKISLKIDEVDPVHVVVKDVALHPVQDSITHVDFYVLKNEGNCVKVPVRFVGTAKCVGLKRAGFLHVATRYLTVNCNVDNIPTSIDIDISDTQIGDVIKASNISLPNGCDIAPSSRNKVIASILGKG